MTLVTESFKVKNNQNKPKFHDVTKKAKEIVSNSNVRNGIAVIYSQHTTCSVIIQEECHDTIYDGTKYILQDLLEVFDNIIPKCIREGQYLHPGPEHVRVAKEDLNEKAIWSLNTDAHLRSCIIGRSESIPIINGNLELGNFGHIYFVDFDSVRQRERNVLIQIVGE